MSGIRVRASRCLLAALVTMTAACAADAPRAVGPPAPIEELSIGSFGTAQSIRGLLTFLSAEPLITTPEAFARMVKRDLAKWAVVVKESGARVD